MLKILIFNLMLSIMLLSVSSVYAWEYYIKISLILMVNPVQNFIREIYMHLYRQHALVQNTIIDCI